MGAQRGMTGNAMGLSHKLFVSYRQPIHAARNSKIQWNELLSRTMLLVMLLVMRRIICERSAIAVEWIIVPLKP